MAVSCHDIYLGTGLALVMTSGKGTPEGFAYEASMTTGAVCPFYGKNDDYCDVGCGYISPYDVNRIIKYCSCRYKDCLKYQELAERFPGELSDLVSMTT